MASKSLIVLVKPFITSAFFLLAALVYPRAFALPWLEPGNERARHHLQVLVDSGSITTPITGWPVMWTGVKQGLDEIDPSRLTADQLWSYQYLKHEMRLSMEPTSVRQRTQISNAPIVIGNFASDAREQRELELGVAVTTNKTAFRLQGSFISDPLDDKRYRLDGSYISRLVGNWAIGAGAIDRWWGPGWESSLILSHSARPSPGIFIQRALAAPFKPDWLAWLGPWQVTSFLSQLESDRAVEKPLLWGMRVSFRPLQSLEIGFSRTAMWGGKGRPNGPGTFGRLLVGRDNVGDAGTSFENEPGNQLGGIDFRWGFRVAGFTPAIYGQFIGEDEAGGMPSRSIGLAGAELATRIGDTSARFSLETSNTLVYFYETEKKRGNVAYEHHIYSTGYRYRGRPIGAATDNDSEATTLRAQLYLSNGTQLNLSWAHLRINTDDNSGSRGGNIYGASKTVTDKWTIDYAVPLTNVSQMSLGVFKYTDPMRFQNFVLSEGAYLGVTHQW